MKLNSKLYDILKWLTLICIPALTTLYAVIALTCKLPYADEITKISAAVCTCLGTLIGISTAEFNKQA